MYVSVPRVGASILVVLEMELLDLVHAVMLYHNLGVYLS